MTPMPFSPRCSPRCSLWLSPASMATTYASSHTARRAPERPTPWRCVSATLRQRAGAPCLEIPLPLPHTPTPPLFQGPRADPGINQRALRELFSLTAKREGEWRYSLLVSVLEIYNETVRDLLSPDHTRQRMDVKQGPAGVYVPGLTQVQVTSLEEVNKVSCVPARTCRRTGP